MIKQLETAIALDPNFADPYSLLAFAQMYAGDPAKGLATIQKAVALSPRNEIYQFDLAQMYLNNRQPDPAIPILQGVGPEWKRGNRGKSQWNSAASFAIQGGDATTTGTGF